MQGIWPHLTVRGDLLVFLEFRQGPWGSSGIATGTSGNLSCCLREVKSPFEREVKIALEVLQGNRASSRVEGDISWVFFFFFSSCGGSMGFLSNCKEDLREPSMLPQGSQASFQVAKAPQDSS